MSSQAPSPLPISTYHFMSTYDLAFCYMDGGMLRDLVVFKVRPGLEYIKVYKNAIISNKNTLVGFKMEGIHSSNFKLLITSVYAHCTSCTILFLKTKAYFPKDTQLQLIKKS